MRDAAEKYSPQIRGVAVMTLAALVLTINDAMSKYLTQTYAVGQVITLRQFCSLFVIVPYIHWVAGWKTIRVRNQSGMGLRALLFVATTGFIVWSLSLLPLALVTSIAFASPIFVVALSQVLIGERVSLRRWLAVIIGFFGVLIILRPGGAQFDPVLILPVLAAFSAGLRDVLTRRLAVTDSSISILFWSTLAVVVLTSVTAFWGWRPVTAADAALLLANGVVGGIAHFLIIEALRLGDASLVAPFRYTGILWATLLGVAIWGQFPDAWTLLGAAVIIASGIYIIERNARRRT